MTEPTPEEEMERERGKARSAMAKLKESLREALDSLSRDDEDTDEIDEAGWEAWWADPKNKRPQR